MQFLINSINAPSSLLSPQFPNKTSSPGLVVIMCNAWLLYFFLFFLICRIWIHTPLIPVNTSFCLRIIVFIGCHVSIVFKHFFLFWGQYVLLRQGFRQWKLLPQIGQWCQHIRNLEGNFVTHQNKGCQFFGEHNLCCRWAIPMVQWFKLLHQISFRSRYFDWWDYWNSVCSAIYNHIQEDALYYLQLNLGWFLSQKTCQWL